jgi:hypothetical protein
MRRELHLQPIYLVERYLPGLTDDAAIALVTGLKAATRQTGDAPTTWLASTALLHEETTFCAFSAPSINAVRLLNELASAPYERVVDALLIRPH